MASNKNLDLALLLLRLAVGVIFILAGWGKLTGIEGTQGFFGSVGIPIAGVMAWVVALIEFIGGILVLVGYKIRYPAILLACVMVGVIFFVRIGGEFSGMRLEITLLVMSLALYFTGSGSYSVDSRLGGQND